MPISVPAIAQPCIDGRRGAAERVDDGQHPNLPVPSWSCAGPSMACQETTREVVIIGREKRVAVGIDLTLHLAGKAPRQLGFSIRGIWTVNGDGG